MRFRDWNHRLRSAAIAGGLGLSAAGVTIVALQLRSGETIDGLRRMQMQAADDRDLRELLHAWQAEDGDLTFLIERLADDRAAVASAAGEVLHEQLTDWQRLRSADSSPRVVELARLLATSAVERPPAGRKAASSLAQRILRWPLDERKVDAAKLLADCDLVLRADAQRREQDLLLAVATAPSTGDAAMMVGRRADANVDGDVAIAPSLAGGGLPWSAIELPIDEPAAANADDLPPPIEHEPSFETPGEIYAPLATPLDLLDGKEHADDRTASQRDGDGNSLRRTDGQQHSAGESLQAVDEWSLMQRLRNPDEARVAEAELRSRGHNARTLALARSLTNADPQVRIELAEKLPQIDGIDPQPWLLQLSRDENAEVRRAAVTVIASSNDASVTRWLAELRDAESDPRVAATIDKLLRRR